MSALSETLLRSDAGEQLAALAAGRISARELLAACVARADATQARLNAVIARDLDRAFAEARRIDERRARGEPLGPLAGLPMTVKDHLDVEGFPSSNGGDASLLKRDVKDAAVVAKVRAAGAIVWGHSNLPPDGGDVQTYNALYGTTNNPWDVARTPGGSSGGAAVAIASGVTALEIGSDLGGSLRHPANFCGVFSHKPTYGLVSMAGATPAPQPILANLDMAVLGPMARSTRDLRLLLSILTDGEVPAQAPAADLRQLKIALWLEEPGFTLDPQVKAPLAGFAERLAATGAPVEPVTSPAPTDAMMFAYTILFYAILGRNLPWLQRSLYEASRGPAKLLLALGARPLSMANAIVGVTARHREWLLANETSRENKAGGRRIFHALRSHRRPGRTGRRLPA